MVNQCFNNVLVYNLDILSFVVLLFYYTLRYTEHLVWKNEPYFAQQLHCTQSSTHQIRNTQSLLDVWRYRYSSIIFIFTLFGLWNWDIYIWCPAHVSLRTSLSLSSGDLFLLPCHANHLFLIWSQCVGPSQPFSVALRNSWISFKIHVEQQLYSQHQLSQELNCLCGSGAIQIILSDSLGRHIQSLSA